MATVIHQHRIIFCLLLIIAVHMIAARVSTPGWIQLLVNSFSCVYIGCFLAGKIEKRKQLESNQIKRQDLGRDTETLTQKDAYLFPVTGSLILFSIYLLYKYLPQYYLNLIFSVHFIFLGFLCVSTLIEFPMSKFAPQAWSSIYVIKRKINLNFYVWKKSFDLELNKLQAMSMSLALFPTIVYSMDKNWVANNVFGISFSIIGIEQVVLPKFKIGFILLWLLFFYDIFWVYCTDVMISVAKNLDVPIKLIFPTQLEDQTKKNMLGLGDIVIPGIFLALCLKYDIDKYFQNLRNKKLALKEDNLDKISTPTFSWGFFGYVLGMVITFLVMVIFNHAQPALLFLVPGCTLSILLKAFIYGELKEIWNYDEAKERQEDPETDKKSQIKEISQADQAPSSQQNDGADKKGQ